MSITASVGRGGANVPADVKTVQKLLNAHAQRIGFATLVVDGVVGPKTIGAIEAYQRSIGLTTPDGRVDVGGRTIKALTGATAGGAAEPKNPKDPADGDWGGDSSQWPEQKKLDSLNEAFRPKVIRVLAKLREKGFQAKIFYG